MAKQSDGWPLLWFGLIGAGIVALIAMLGEHSQSVWGVRDTLKVQVERALASEGLDFATVRMDGQRAVLSGFAPDEESKARAAQAALTAAGPGGRWAGGVTSVDTEELAVGAPVSPYTWEAVRRGQSVTLRGHAPSAQARRSLVEAARRAFPEGQVADEMSLAAGAPDAAWTQIAADAVQQLSRLNRGEARLTDAQLVLLGDGDAASVEAARAFYADGLPQPYRARFEVTVTGERLGIEEVADLDLSGRNPDACQEAFARIMQTNVINFETGSAVVDPSSQSLLSNLASIALRCDDFTILVSGHTDNVGTRELNMDLSERRAAAVVSYLAQEGVRAERLRAIGYGPDRPRATNATRDGQAANRRIEFLIER